MVLRKRLAGQELLLADNSTKANRDSDACRIDCMHMLMVMLSTGMVRRRGRSRGGWRVVRTVVVWPVGWAVVV